MSIRITKIALTVAVCLPTAALAQQPVQSTDMNRNGSWEFSLGAGVRSLDSALREFLGSGAPESRFANEVMPGAIVPAAEARIGYNMSRHFGVSAGLGAAMGAGVKYINPTAAMTYTIDLNRNTSPFLMIGTDLTRIEGENDRVTHSTWGAHAGLGLRHMIGNNVALRAEGRMQVSHYDEVPMSRHTAWSPLAQIGLSVFSRGHTPQVVIAQAPTRVDTLRTVRVDTVTIASTEPVRQVTNLNSDQVVLRVQFRTDRAEILPESRGVLNTVAAAIKATPNSRWQVEGHTDSVGTAASNLTLSQDRAQAVVAYLVSQGVSRASMTAIGYGQEREVFSNSTAEGRAANRRVQLRRVPPAPATIVP